MPGAADPRFGAQLPVGGDVADFPVIFGLALDDLLESAARVDEVASALPSTRIDKRFVKVTSTSKVYYDDGTNLTLLNPATALGGTPPPAVAVGGAAAEGASTAAARLDHGHALAVGPPVASAPGDTAATGATGKAADAGHRHAREARQVVDGTYISNFQDQFGVPSPTYAGPGYYTVTGRRCEGTATAIYAAGGTWTGVGVYIQLPFPLPAEFNWMDGLPIGMWSARGYTSTVPPWGILRLQGPGSALAELRSAGNAQLSGPPVADIYVNCSFSYPIA